MKVAVIGCGVMGSALAGHFVKQHTTLLYDRTEAKKLTLAQKLGAEACDLQALKEADVLILAVKPKDLAQVAAQMSSFLHPNQILISVLGGTSTTLLQKSFPLPKIIRAIPNLPLICGEGVIGFVDIADQNTKEQVQALFQGLGLLIWLSEEKLEGLSALAGSGPAFIFVLIEALIDSGIFLGFTQAESIQIVLKTLEGSIALLRATEAHPGELKWKVTSPRGTTISGLKVLEKSGIRGILMDTFEATRLKAEQMHRH